MRANIGKNENFLGKEDSRDATLVSVLSRALTSLELSTLTDLKNMFRSVSTLHAL